ncbi:MAG: hypothetical protein KDD10_15075 [Phaeodactylibacter sp.]|nr:hypothetical protein [Phaeodactylibacter sp.]MCB9296724.1 hypothetical protein [Lewinellaceae bacterium]
MQKNDVEARVEKLERQVKQLAEVLEAMREGILFSSQGMPPALAFKHGKGEGPLRLFGKIEAGDFGKGYEAFRLSAAGQARFDLDSGGDMLLQAADTFKVNAPKVRIEAQRMDLDGELSANLCQSEPFSWRSGQPPARLVHQSQGIPVLTELKGKFKSSSSGIRIYIDPSDGYWYLDGDSSQGAEIFARVVCVGRV